MTQAKKKTAAIRDTKTGDVETNQINVIKWKRFIDLIAAGVKRADAEREINVNSHSLQTYVITKPKARDEYEEAKLVWLRRHIDYEAIDAILGCIAAGATVKTACSENLVNPDAFLRWVVKDPVLQEEYQMARQVQAEGMLDDMIEIADTGHRDVTILEGKNGEYEKINFDVIQRSRVRLEQRRWHMAKMNPKRFGEKQYHEVDQTVTVDHAAGLEKARKRKTDLAKQRAGEKSTDGDQPTLH